MNKTAASKKISLNSAKARALYLHYPICQHVCSYCDFNVYSKSKAKDSSFDERWLAGLKRDAEALRVYGSNELDSLYLGGGTPSLVAMDVLEALMGFLRSEFSFSKHAEISIECNPESFDEAFLKSILALGWNRISLGVQSFKEKQLKRLERLSTRSRIVQSIELLKKYNCNFNVDLMMGLPDQTPVDLENDLDQLLKFDPPHISVYVLGLSESHKWKTSEFMKNRLPDDENTAEFYKTCHDRFCQAGYDHYEVSNFSKSGRESLHNQAYWNPDKKFLAMGPGAHGFLSDSDGVFRYEMRREPSEWLSSQEPFAWKEYLNAEQQDLESLYLGLRSGAWIDATQWNPQRLDLLESEGFIIRENSRFTMQRSRWVMLDSVVNALLSSKS